MINLKNLFITRRYTVKLRLTLFVMVAIVLVILISVSAVIGLNNTYNSLSNLRDRSLNQMFSSMTLGVKTSQISTYSTRLSQTIRALEYKEASDQLERHIQQVHQILNEIQTKTTPQENARFANIIDFIHTLEKSIKELLNQAYQRHVIHTTISSQLNQSLLHIRHMKRLAKRTALSDSFSQEFLTQVTSIENLIEDATHSSFSPSTFLSIRAIFSFLPDMSAHPEIESEWKKVEVIFLELTNNANKLADINWRILFLVNQIDALVKNIDAGYTKLAQDKIEEVNSVSEKIQYHLSNYILSILLFSLFIIGLIIIWGIYLYQLIGYRLSSITQALIRLSQGDKNIIVPQQAEDEIGELARAFDIFHQNVIKLDYADALLKEKSELLEQTFLAMRDGLAIFDVKQKLVSYNAQFMQLLNLTEQQLLSCTMPQLATFLSNHHASIYGLQIPINLTYLLEMRSEQEPLEIEYNHSIFEWRISMLQDGGLVVFLIDRTQRKKLEIDLAHSQKMRTIGHLTGGIAHDFNNLLAVIIGNLDLIDSASLTEKQAKRIQNALKAAENSATLTQRLLAYARKQPLHPSAFDINQLLCEFTDLIEHTLPPTIKVRLDLAENLPFVYMDRNQLETALVNLLLNAKDALNSEGEIIIRSTQLMVERTYQQEKMIQIEIIDNGCGMDQQTQNRIFEPFFTTKKHGKGSGLGLSMVYGFIRQSKGRISVQSSLGKGTTVNLQLPLAQQIQTSMEANITQQVSDRFLYSILLVEDQYSLREILEEQLQSASYQTISFENAESAIEYLKCGHKVDYLLSDIVLSGKLTGIDLAKFVRTYCPSIKILLMTGNYSAHSEEAISFPLLHKPFKLNELKESLNNL
ncbi:ATP-binding protein [Testudinibacter sp. TR-2022]|uniref:ATP-binding protein n=1 Tax=Testudinibacter sp. TR-2022 TaxID=2585029 RepID=UPI00111955ED|nr:ATP-binding protein [Testudinibacter sp. TR-2022]TNH24443.1 response regulator [Testudinibacter sp. TR-2022]TNH26675.1 response regulator [Testudinibacter sp. TR-2022]